MFEELEEEAETKDEPSRVWWQWWAPIAMVTVFIVVPPAVYHLVSGLILLILMAVLTVIIALVDGATFPVFVFLAWAASKLGAVVDSKAGKS